MIFTHAACLEHQMGAGHPESPARLEATAEVLWSPNAGSSGR